MYKTFSTSPFVLIILIFSVASFAIASKVDAGQDEPYSPPLRQPADTMLYWGDLHVHSNLSADAYINGVRNISQADAYRFAKGEIVQSESGVEARLHKPLDFLAVTDHAENIGLYKRIEENHPLVVGTTVGDRYAEVLSLFEKFGLRDAFTQVMKKHGAMPDMPDELRQSVWDEVVEVADAYNEPGRFTALIGYEWTSMINGDNLHRVVLYKDDGDKAGQLLPVSAVVDPDPEKLWQGLEAYEKQTGGQIIAIPHNGNLSNGQMFAPNRINGSPIDRRYAETRTRWEPVYEVTQFKGDGEAHPSLSPTDEFANFETWDQTNVAFTTPKEPWMLRYEYARTALLNGLNYEQQLGANPFKFGLLGSSDSHTGLSTVTEDNFFGKFTGSNPSPGRSSEKMGGQLQSNQDLGASGLTAVWAVENTREAIFDALMRREVYATTGSRIRLRFFGGWKYSESDIHRADYARHAYRNGVPMGGDLPPAAESDSPERAPVFLIHAARDPDGAFLDRVQVIKGWADGEGGTHEKIYNVALADARKRTRWGKVKPVGNTVDVDSAEYANSIGAPELAAWWRDPDFDPAQPAFYYVRVLEIPTPRWTTYDAAYFDIPLSGSVPSAIQDRAYSSPIWYTP